MPQSIRSRFFRVRTWGFPTSLLVVSGSACHDTGTYGVGTSCGPDEPCRAPLVCDQGRCMIPPADGTGSDVTLEADAGARSLASLEADAGARSLAALGDPCLVGTDCGSTHCVDEVCCESVCPGQCEACNLPGRQGQCAALSSGQPVGHRPACTQAGSPCGGSCTGDAECTYPGATTICSGQSGCADAHTLVAGTACDGRGSCSVLVTSACASPEVCNVNTDGRCGRATYTQLDVSESHSCAVVSDGSLRCWGSNALGQLGMDGPGIRTTPCPVPEQQGVRAVATGWGHTCVVLEDGQVHCWGVNYNGDLGCPSPISFHGAEKCLTFPAGSGVAEVVAGGEQSCARMTGGRMACWGRNDFGEVGDGTSGRDGLGGFTDAHRREPVEVLGIRDAVQMAAGVWHTCAVSESGAVRCWGRNEDGALGTGDTSDHAIPSPVVGIDGINAGAFAVAATADHTCVILRDGSLRCFGQNPFGQLGDGSTLSTPVPVLAQPPMTASAVAVGGRFTCALVTNGSVVCWGAGPDGELGNGAYTDSAAPVTVELPRGTAVRAIVSKYQHTCVLSAEGRIWCWGANAHGQLGNGTVDASNRPVEVRGPTDD